MNVVVVGCGVGRGWRRVVVGMRAPPCAVVVGVWASGAAPFPAPVRMSSYRVLGRALGHGVSDYGGHPVRAVCLALVEG